MIRLPNEIWLNVLNILGNKGQTRDLVNLIKALNFNMSLSYKYLKKEFAKSRSIFYKENITYKQRMIELWERTGIDDGVPYEYLLKNLNKKTRMFRTIWSYEVLKDKQNKNCLFIHNIFNYMNLGNKFQQKYTYSFFEDKRPKPNNCIDWFELSDKSNKLISRYVINFKNKNIVDYTK